MCNLDDDVLVERFVRRKSEEAFRVLSARYVRLVYGVCLRRLGRSDLAEDATQAVFLIFLNKAHGLLGRPSIANWLYTCALQVSATAARSESNRLRREKLAMRQKDTVSTEDKDALSKLLDSSLARLGQKDREAIVLRYLEAKSFGEVGRLLGVQEDAARMRVNRAVERLKVELSKAGLSMTAIEFEAAVPLVVTPPPHGFDVGPLLGRHAPKHIVKLAKGSRRMAALSHPIPYVCVLALLSLGGARMFESGEPPLAPARRLGLGVMTASIAPPLDQQQEIRKDMPPPEDPVKQMIALFPGTWNWSMTTEGGPKRRRKSGRATVTFSPKKRNFSIACETLDGSLANDTSPNPSDWRFELDLGAFTMPADENRAEPMNFVSGGHKAGEYLLAFQSKEAHLAVNYSSRRFTFVLIETSHDGSGHAVNTTQTTVFQK